MSAAGRGGGFIEVRLTQRDDWRDNQRIVQGSRAAIAVQCVEAIRPLSGEQFIEHDTQGIHIRRCSECLAGQLFRGGGFRCQCLSDHGRTRLVFAAGRRIAEQSCDPEVQ